ncbi:MAG: DUF5106 domain-containing protein [Bacteroidota bacterium]|nr:DUF5106 domain-containing protein [Bacteroidota bacterium]
MKPIAVLFFLITSTCLFAQEGYEIKVILKPFKNEFIYLGHYQGKQLPIIDSVKLNDKSEGVFKGTKKLGGGIYLVGFPDKSRHFEILVDKNQKFSVIADSATVDRKIDFINSPENEQFRAYQDFMMKNGTAVDALYKKRSANPADSVSINAEIENLNKSIRQYRLDIINKDAIGILAALLKAMRDPEVPANPDPSDSTFAYRFYKNNFWNGVNFWDERLMRTPFFESRIDKYYEQLVYPSPDSVIKEIDHMLGYASVNEEMQKFLLLKFVNRYLNQKYMWEDAVFVHLFEKYFAQKNYSWLTEAGKKTITDRAYSLMANIFGKPAADIELPNLDGKKNNIYSISSPYTLVVIWDPRCGHCKEVLPRLDSLYHAKWKAMGLQPFAMAKETDGSKKDWTEFIEQHDLKKGWMHVYYSKGDEKTRVDSGIPSYSQLYDVQSFPTLYLLDKDKRIIAKKVTEEQIDEILLLRTRNQN